MTRKPDPVPSEPAPDAITGLLTAARNLIAVTRAMDLPTTVKVARGNLAAAVRKMEGETS